MRKLDINSMIIVRSSGAMVAHGNLAKSFSDIVVLSASSSSADT